jgi:adenylate cyclase
VDLSPRSQERETSDTASPGLAGRVREHLEHLLDSLDFKATEMQRAFLRFVVEKALDGQADEIKGFTVATEVFGRSEEFDQSRDPIVSIQANKLRRTLELYYLTEGKEDPCRIDIPKGTYVPVFHDAYQQESDSAAAEGLAIESGMDSWPALLVMPLDNLTGDASKDFIGIGLSTELAIEIARFNGIKVMCPVPGEGKTADFRDARFVISGSVYQYGEHIKIAVQLTDQNTRQQIWGESYKASKKASDLMTFQEQAARLIAVKVAGFYGAIASVITAETKNKPPSKLLTYEAILRYSEYDQVQTSDSFMRALEALEHAARIEPDCPRVLSRLAHLYANSYNLDYPWVDKPLATALRFAERAADINPFDQYNLVVLSLVRFSSDELSAALEESKKALALNPKSLFLMEAIAYIMILSGDWEDGETLARKAISLNPYYRTEIHYALWLNCLRAEDYERAHLELLHLRKPSVFWYPLSKAATLGLLGRKDEGEKSLQILLSMKPDFAQKARILIERYIKFEPLVERVISGLENAGLVLQ